MSESQQNIIEKVLKVINDCEAVEGMPYSVSKELKTLVRELQVV